MYSLLVVDDEKYAVDAIARGIEWADIGISAVHTADCALGAMDVFGAHQIDVMICDVEMPGNNGLQLLEWVKAHYPETDSVFLSGHAEFAYAQKAVHLGSSGYLLKPVDYGQLKAAVASMLGRIEQRRQAARLYKTLESYKGAWEAHLPVLAERLWQDVLAGRMALGGSALDSTLALYNITVGPAGRIIPVLVTVEQWDEALDAQGEAIVEYAVRNIAAELFPGASVVQDHDGNNVVLLCGAGGNVNGGAGGGAGGNANGGAGGNAEGGDDEAEAAALCRRFAAAASRSLGCDVSCYVGEPANIDGLPKTYEALLEMARTNVTRKNAVLLQRDCAATGTDIRPLPPFLEWAPLIEMSKKAELRRRIADSLAAEGGAHEARTGFCYGLIHMIYAILHKKKVAVGEVFAPSDLEEGIRSAQSLRHLEAWAVRIVNTCIDYLEAHRKNNSAIIRKVRAYIDGRLGEELGRDDIAMQVYLNPAYLSRLFKKEVGISLSEYIARARMDRAKALIVATNEKISVIGESVGYGELSHFTRMFKKTVGVSPQEYRRQYGA
ncbi:MAG: response regulator [Clostridiales bacterium]|jgi:two-component system response regulator YesN|nr:response regulator [Clostridiales bacterium]